MNKPPLDTLPSAVYERILWDVDLDYCSYESSKAACIHDILVGSYLSGSNKDSIEYYYKNLDNERFLTMLRQELENAESSANRIREMIKAVRREN